MSRPRLLALGALALVVACVAAVLFPPPEKVDEATFDRISRAFVVARIDDLLGEFTAESYRRIAADPAAAADDRAAELAAIAAQLAIAAP